ncbi:MAG: DUF4394 domain-containing protein [Marinobacter sp.]|uniref:DUF4394 domain-containing protein n=1 Tax=Marinobacter sp. TaxID=50741 RepID=UPI003C5C6DE2
MNNKVFTVSMLSVAVSLAGCFDGGSGSGSGNRADDNQLDCTPASDLAALTAGDMLAVTSESNCLVRFSVSDPSEVTVIGPLDAAGDVVGLDFRPASGELFALTAMGELLLVDPLTAQTTQVTASIGELQGARYDIDFNPAANALRLISDARQNFRMGSPALVESAMMEALVDGKFGYLQGVVATAYTNVNPDQSGTQMYVISADSRTFYQQDPNVGLLTRIGGLFEAADTLDVKGYNVFTTADDTNEHYAVFDVDGTVGLYAVDPANAGTTLLKELPPAAADGNYMDLTVAAGGSAAEREFTVYEQSAADTFELQVFELDPENPDSGTPLPDFENTIPLGGLEAGDVIVGFDLRTTGGADNGLYAVADSGRIYSIAITTPAIIFPDTADASEVALLSEDLSGQRFDIDFNPRADLLRIIGDAGQNLRVNLDQDRVLAEMARDAGFAFVDGTVRLDDTMAPIPVAVAYRAAPMQLMDATPSLDFQYLIDARNSGLARVAVPNDGALVAVGEGLAEGLTLPSDGMIQQSMDIAQAGTAYAALRAESETASTLYTVSLSDGTAEAVGVIGGASAAEGVNAISVFIPESTDVE